MFTSKVLIVLAGACALQAAAAAGGVDQMPTSAAESPHAGTPATALDIAPWNIDVEPDGAGLPPGGGNAVQGAAVYAERCASCHGADLAGRSVPGHGSFPALAGGQGTLASDRPKKTVGSYWPYAPTVFDYIRRAMPFDRPQTLTANEVYAVTAFILERNHIIADRALMNAKTLPLVVMPNRDGFFSDRPPR